ncbi:histidine phosphatase family protein [Streptomyces sp. NPDC004065]|uniref:histidine phosphatase family protein n=1 Tax=Streptomyces sp. NPDC004065 TaxID=3364689 RepID=UPI00384AE5C4
MTIRLTFLCAPGGAAASAPLVCEAPGREHGLPLASMTRAALPSHGPAVRAPSIRCAQTASAFGLVTTSDPALRDLDLGAWSCRTIDEVAAFDPDGFTAWLTDPDAAPHGGESVRGLCRRTADWLRGLAPGPDHTVAVTEAAVVRAALIHALAVPARAFWHLAVPPLSTVSLTRHNGCWDIRVGCLTPRQRQRWVQSRSAALAHPRRPAPATGAASPVPAAGAYPSQYP